MAISFDNSDNPQRIFFNGTNLDAVFFDDTFVWGKNSGGEQEGDPSDWWPDGWPSDIPAPPQLPSVITSTWHDDKVWLRDFTINEYNLALVSDWEGLWYEYKYIGDSTVEIDVSSSNFLGITNQLGKFYIGEDPDGEQATITGVPQGYKLSHVYIRRPSTTITLGLWNYYINQQGYAVRTTKAGSGLFNVTDGSVMNNMSFKPLEVSTSYNGDYLVYCDEINKWSYSGSCEFSLFMQV